MHGNLLRRCDMCPNWCDRRNEEIGNEKILMVERRNEKNLSRNWVWRTPGEWLENMLDFVVTIPIRMPWVNLMVMLTYFYKGGIMSRYIEWNFDEFNLMRMSWEIFQGIICKRNDVFLEIEKLRLNKFLWNYKYYHFTYNLWKITRD